MGPLINGLGLDWVSVDAILADDMAKVVDTSLEMTLGWLEFQASHMNAGKELCQALQVVIQSHGEDNDFLLVHNTLVPLEAIEDALH